MSTCMLEVNSRLHFTNTCETLTVLCLRKIRYCRIYCKVIVTFYLYFRMMEMTPTTLCDANQTETLCLSCAVCAFTGRESPWQFIVSRTFTCNVIMQKTFTYNDIRSRMFTCCVKCMYNLTNIQFKWWSLFIWMTIYAIPTKNTVSAC